MLTRSARFYDALYGFKNYDEAVARLRALIAERLPDARTLLDVACGTGKHLERLRCSLEVEGLDVNPELLEIARGRCPGVPLHQADMIGFDLGRTFDVVTCLFSSIAYVRTADNLRHAIATMARHVYPGGLLLVEPFFSPERFWTGTITANFVDEPDLKIAWMYTSNADGPLTVLDIHYLVGTPEGVEHFTERHALGLFTDAEYHEAFAAAGLTVDYDPVGFFGRGLYVARRVPPDG